MTVRVPGCGRGRVEHPLGREVRPAAARTARPASPRRTPWSRSPPAPPYCAIRSLPFRASVSADRQVLPGARRAYSHCSPCSQPSRSPLGPGRFCVSSHRSYACWTTATVNPSPRSVRTLARINPSTVNRVIWVSSVTVPARPPAPATNVRTPSGYFARIDPRVLELHRPTQRVPDRAAQQTPTHPCSPRLFSHPSHARTLSGVVPALPPRRDLEPVRAVLAASTVVGREQTILEGAHR